MNTPGPWVEFADNGETVAIMPAGRDGDICKFSHPFPKRDDAQLMAQAPGLLIENDRLRDLIEGLIEAYDSKNLKMESPSVLSPNDENWPWHEEWLHHAREAVTGD